MGAGGRAHNLHGGATSAPMVSMQTFAFSYGRLKPLLRVLGAGPAHSSVTLDEEFLPVRMSWFFRAQVPRSSITGAQRFTGVVSGWGAHGWQGVWLVNGSSRGIVSIDIDPPASSRPTG